MKAKFKVDLQGGSVTGQEIADLIKKIAKNRYRQDLSYADDDSNGYQIGNSSDYPYGDSIIGVGPNVSTDIFLDKEYKEIYVLNWEYGEDKYADYCTGEKIAKSCKGFRDSLNKEIIEYIKTKK